MDMEERKMDDVYKLVDIFCKKDPLIDGKTVLRSGYLKEDSLPSPFVSKRKLKKMRRKEREKSAGAKWYNLPAKEMTKETIDDLSVLQMRSALDPKRFYKKNDMKTLPKYFQIGTIVESPADFYHSRIPKKQRKRTLVQELLADANFKKFKKRKTQEIKARQPLRRQKKIKKKNKDRKNKI